MVVPKGIAGGVAVKLRLTAGSGATLTVEPEVTVVVPKATLSVKIVSAETVAQVNVRDDGLAPLTVPPAQPGTEVVAEAGVNCAVSVAVFPAVTNAGPAKLVMVGWVTTTGWVLRAVSPAWLVTLML